jgi:hypothetical protein
LDEKFRSKRLQVQVEHALTAIKTEVKKHAEGDTFCVLFLPFGAPGPNVTSAAGDDDWESF